MKIVIHGIDGFKNINVYYGDTDTAYNHLKYWATLIDTGYLGKSLGLGKNDYGKPGIFYA